MIFKHLAARILMSEINHINNSDTARQALDKLAGQGRGFNLPELVERFRDSGGDITRVTRTWLADDANDVISPLQVEKVIGARPIDAFARKLGMDRDAALQKLALILPELVDQSSQGGHLLGSRGKKSFLQGFSSRFLNKTA